MANIVPGALWRPIDVGNRAARRKGRGLIGHIAVVNSTLLIPGPLSTRPSDWHFYLPKNPYPTGERFAQLIDLDLQSWSSAAGNATCPSFESEGGVGADVNGPWTPNQIESAAIILAYLHRTEGVPLQDMVNSLPTSRGFGIHRYGIDPYRVPGGEKWSSVYAKACPGDVRARQVPQIVARAQQIVNGEDMPLTQQDIDAVVTAIYNAAIPRSGTKSDGSPQAGKTNLLSTLAWLDSNFAGLAAAIGKSVDPKAVADAIVSQLPASDAQKVATLVLAGLNGAQLNVTQPS